MLIGERAESVARNAAAAVPTAQLRLRGDDGPLSRAARVARRRARDRAVMVVLFDAGEPDAAGHAELVCRSLADAPASSR